MDYLHSSLTGGFKIILDGTSSLPDFRAGDKLNVGNGMPESGEYALIKHHGEHEAVMFDDRQYDPARCLVIGTINSYERSVNADCELYLGNDPDKKHAPPKCRKCTDLELVEMGGEVEAFCSSGSRLVVCNLDMVRRCERNKRPGTLWGA